MTGIAIALLGLLAVAIAGCVYFGKAALDEARGRGDARELAAQREGELKVAGVAIGAANTSTVTALQAEKNQEQRGDRLEKDLAHDEALPHGGLGGLASLSDLPTTAAGADPNPGADPGSAKR